MKIGVSTANLTSGGGMEHYALDLIRSFLDRGQDMEVVTRRFDPAHPVAARLGSRLHKVAVGFLPGKLRNGYFSWRLDCLRKKLGIDVVLACGLARRPDWAVCGGTHRGYLAALNRRASLSDRWQIGLEESQYSYAKVIVAHSKLMRDELIEYYDIDPAKIRLIYPPVDHARFRPLGAERRRELRRAFGLPNDKRVFLFPSGGHERKGLPFLRKFFERTELPVVLAVAGRAVAGRNIISLGYVQKMEELYPAADATILAPSYEPFGLVGIESALCGVPAILPTNTGCTEVLAPPALIAFRPNDREGLERAVRDIVARERDSYPDLTPFINYNYQMETHVDAILNLAKL